MTERGMPGLAGMEARPVKPFVPMSARLLLGAALVDVVMQVFARGLIGGFRDPSPAIVIGVLSYATFFVLAAAVIIGAQGWPAGRPWLLAGAGVFAASGLLNLGFWVWYWAQTGGTNVFADLTDSTAWWLSLRAFAETAAGATAALLGGGHLGGTPPHSRPPTASRRSLAWHRPARPCLRHRIPRVRDPRHLAGL